MRFQLLGILVLGLCSNAWAGETTTYFHNDVAGSPSLASDTNGRVVWRESYRPYGERLIKASSANSNGVWFAGKQHDEQTGLSYLGARYYDPILGRFMGTDPAPISLENLHSFNRYAYANNNPHRYVDPDGRDAVEIEYDGYEIQTGIIGKQPLGHTGILLINEKTGVTRYYEYGRYAPRQDEGAGKRLVGVKLPGNDGNIRRISVPDVVIGSDGKPTPESLKKVYDFLSKAAGKGHKVDPDYDEDADFDKMEAYVNKLANDANRPKYSVAFNNCDDFGENVRDAGDPWFWEEGEENGE